MTYPSVRAWLIERASLEPSLLEGPGFDTHVAERVRATRAGGEAAYLALLTRSAGEVDLLMGGIAVPETWFFRYARSFAMLVDSLRKRLESGATTLRMCSVGCASGEEPYGMAMAALHAGWKPGEVTIDAIDRSERALERAAAGVYGAFSLRTELPVWGAGYLRAEGDRIVVDPLVRALVRFHEVDVLALQTLGEGGPYDVVFCRNVLIYLGAAARERLVRTICESLVPGGLFFVGHAEVALCGGPRLRAVDAPHTFVLRRCEEEAGHARVTARPAATVSRGESKSGPATDHSPARPISAPEPAPSLDDARDLADAGRAAEAEALLRKIVARRGASAGALELLGMIRLACDDVAEAKRCFEKAVYLDPTRAGALLQLGVILERQGDMERARIFRERAGRAPGRLGERAV